MRLLTLLPLALAGLAPALGAQATAVAPRRASCDTPDHRAFDFWIGEWAVTYKDGKPSGTNRIEPVLGGCALQESWTGADGNRGHSYSAFDASRNAWHQTWVDAGGNLLRLDGNIRGGAMV